MYRGKQLERSGLLSENNGNWKAVAQYFSGNERKTCHPRILYPAKIFSEMKKKSRHSQMKKN